MSQAALPAVPLETLPTPPGKMVRLSVMMFLQYAIWGAWLPLFFAYLTGYLAIPAEKAGLLFSIGAIGALAAPFVAGQIADRWFNTEKFLAISHVVGAGLVWVLASVDTFLGLAVMGLLYSLVYAPTLALTNSLAFHHLVDRDRDFGKVRVWGTVGWIVVGIGVGQWLLHRYTPPDAPLKQAWVARSESAPDAARAANVRKALEKDDAIMGVKDASGALVKAGAMQELIQKNRVASVDAALTEAVAHATAGSEAVKVELASRGWSAARSEEAAERVAIKIAREDLLARNAATLPAPDALRASLADKAVKAIQHENHVRGMADSLRLSAILGLVMGIYCLTLPRTPPRQGREPFAAKEALQEIGQRRALLVLFLISFPIACVHQFYFVLTAPFLGTLDVKADVINKVFGVGGGGLMTIGQISELAVLALVPFFAKRYSRKVFLMVGLAAYILRFFIFAYVQQPWAVIPALALHGVCFGCFFFIAFMIVDELTTKDVRASAQGLYNLVIVGLGTIAGNLFAGYIGKLATRTDKSLDFQLLFSVPMWIVVGCALLLFVLYPNRRSAQAGGFPVADAAGGGTCPRCGSARVGDYCAKCGMEVAAMEARR